MARAVRRAGVPTVELRSPRLNPGVPWVGVDNRAMGQIVADHLLQRGFRHFGVYEMGTEVFFEERRVNFIQTIAGAGYTCDTYHSRGRPEKPAQWERHQDNLAAWVAALPKPVGIMACTDQLGFYLLDACARAGAAVPDEVAVVGVENEESLCTMAVPTLSSVRFNAERIGYEAAALLGRMMAGGTPPRAPILIEPLGLVIRGSSDVVAIEDTEIAHSRALHPRAGLRRHLRPRHPPGDPALAQCPGTSHACRPGALAQPGDQSCAPGACQRLADLDRFAAAGNRPPYWLPQCPIPGRSLSTCGQHHTGSIPPNTEVRGATCRK